MSTCRGHHRPQVLTLPVLAGTLLLGCTGGHDRSVQSAQSAPQASEATTTSTNSTEAPTNGSIPDVTPASLTVADLDLYAQAAKARLDFLTQVKKDVDAAKSTQDTAQAMQRSYSEAPDTQAARAEGVTVLHEQQVMRALGNIIATLHMAEAESMSRQVDTAHMDAASLAQVRPVLEQSKRSQDSITKAVMESMRPDVAAAFQQRRANLDSLTFQAMSVFAVTKKT